MSPQKFELTTVSCLCAKTKPILYKKKKNKPVYVCLWLTHKKIWQEDKKVPHIKGYTDQTTVQKGIKESERSRSNEDIRVLDP